MVSATKSRLAGAYNGYKHQDALTAYALVSLLLPATGSRTVTAENKVVPNDKFDDLEITGSRRCRVQIKSHTAKARPLRLADLATNAIEFRIDHALRSFAQDATPADEYRLFTTYFPPEEDLMRYLRPDRVTGPLLPGIGTLRYRLDAQQVWPAGQAPAWKPLQEAKRQDFLAFCQRFVVETGCPVASGDLHAPSLLEQGILQALSEQVGIGSWPNHQRRVEDVAALLMQAAMNARTISQTLDEQAVIRALALRVDYGRVHEQLPIAEARLVPRSESIAELTALLDGQQHVAVVGNPGMGKSWLLHQATAQLKLTGWAVAVHYCFIDLLDADREARASINTMFGSLIAELREVFPQVSHPGGPRFAAGAATLEGILAEARQRVPTQRIALIVDGIDHIDRIGNQAVGASSRLVTELANLQLPLGVALIIGSQPGHHLQEFPSQGSELRLSRWPDELLRGLLERTELRHAYRHAHRTADIERLTTTIIEKAGGSPLYATYLVRTAIAHVQGAEPLTVTEAPVVDIAAYLAALPAPDADLHSYYRWLLDGLASGTRAWWVAELLALLDFPVSAAELKEINPGMAHHVQRALNCLAPVLSEETAYGGLRIYHESFQRYVRQILRDDEADIAALLQPVIHWLGKRGFYEDLRAFRYLPPLLRAAGQLPDMLALVDDDFVAQAAANGQPADAVLAILTLVAEAAADQQAWPDLTRLVELARAAINLYYERLPGDDMAEQYGRAYAALHGADALAARLLHDGRCTFPVEPGLVLCQLCDQQMGAAPWSEYLALLAQQARKEYGLRSENSQAVAPAAQLMGHLRLAGREKAPQWCEKSLLEEGRVHPFQQLTILGEMYGVEAIEEVEALLPTGHRELRAWAAVATLQISGQTAADQLRPLPATIYADLPLENWRLPLRLGADPANAPRHPARLAEATAALLEPETIDVKAPLNAWLTELALAAALGEEEIMARVRLQIPPTFWFRRWLHFCLVLAQPAAPDILIIAAVRELSQDEDLFAGKPSVSSSLFAQEEIQRSFRTLLRRIDEASWAEALHLLVTIGRNTVLWFKGSRSGPLTPDALIDLCLEAADTPGKLQMATQMCRELFAFESRSGDLYDTHATDQLRLVRMLVAIGQQEEAMAAWHEACRFLASYGFHKDITFYEILDPIQSLATADLGRARQCLADIQPIIEGIRVHTDGKETYYAIHGWLDLAAQLHPAGALAYLAHEKTPLICAVGGLDHAWPLALEALADHLDPLTAAAAWLASGSHARKNPAQAMAACERAAQAYPAGLQLWHGVAAALEGEGGEPVAGLQKLLADSAGRLGLPAPDIEPFPVKQESVPGSRQARAASWPDPFLPPPGASSAQLAYAVRQWQNQPETTRASPTALVNALGWRMVELHEAGAATACQELLWQLARSLFRWSGNALLLDLAEGFTLRGFGPLAALAYTLAYTRSTDGWRRFGKAEDNQLFVNALRLDAVTAWAALAQEMAAGVAQGGEYGLTLHAIELLVAGGRSAEAFAAWEAAHRIIALRVPVTGPYDELNHPYKASWEGAENWLVALTMARLNQCELQDKRVALAALVTMARYQPAAIAFGLRFALEKELPATSLTSVLHVLYCGEQAPYPAANLARESLRTIAAGSLLSARVLARQILLRLGEKTPFPPAATVPIAPRVPPAKAEQIMECIGAERTQRIASIWPRFGPAVVGPLDQALSAEIIAHRMENFGDNTGLRHCRSRSLRHLWSPMQEEAERIMQTTGTAVRTALAREGEIDPENETRLGIALLGETELSLRSAMSRCLRPIYLPQPGVYPVGTTNSALLTVPEGPYQDWIVLGWHETQLQIGERYKREPTIETMIYAGVECTLTNAINALPFGLGDCTVWTTELRAFSKAFRGPVAGFDLTSDNFGGLEILCPYANFITANSLKPAPCEQGLTLTDPAGTPALVSHNWRQRLLEEERVIADRTPTQYGVCLLVRPDVFANTLKWAVEPPRLTILTVREELDAP